MHGGTNMYFAIGAMMNKVSLAGRDLHPLDSWPGELLEHELLFQAGSKGSDAMATAAAAPGKTFHGVILKMSDADMVKLDAIEMGYDRCPAQARRYEGGTEVAVTVFVNLSLCDSLSLSFSVRLKTNKVTHRKTPRLLFGLLQVQVQRGETEGDRQCIRQGRRGRDGAAF